MTMTDNSGIYCFYFEKKPNEFYIGKGLSILVRIQNHTSAMIRGTHFNKKVQSYYNKYGLPVFEVLKECSSDQLADLEIFYINEFDSYHNGLNLTYGGEGGFGEGSAGAKYKDSDYYEVLCLIAYTNFPLAYIAELTQVSLHVCKHISRQGNHKYLKDKYPKEFELVERKKYTRDNSAASKGIVYPLLRSPLGKLYEVENVHKFAEEHNLQYQNLHKVLTGKRNNHKGWTRCE